MVDILRDPWIADLSLSRWTISISINIGETMWVCDLLHPAGRGWNIDIVIHIFGAHLAEQVFSQAIPVQRVRIQEFEGRPALRGSWPMTSMSFIGVNQLGDWMVIESRGTGCT